MADAVLSSLSQQGLARISHRNTLSFGTFNKYEYESQAGSGVDAYVIDTQVPLFPPLASEACC
jgi:hypothetical protein